MCVKKLVVLGFGQRGSIYAGFAAKHPDKFRLVALIDNDDKKAELAKKLYLNVPFYHDYRDFIKDGVSADIVFR